LGVLAEKLTSFFEGRDFSTTPPPRLLKHTFLRLLPGKLRFAFLGESSFIQPLIASASPINLHLPLYEQMPWGGEGAAGWQKHLWVQRHSHKISFYFSVHNSPLALQGIREGKLNNIRL
jgi:hypothetical protein